MTYTIVGGERGAVSVLGAERQCSGRDGRAEWGCVMRTMMIRLGVAAALLARELPKLKAKGVTLVHVSELVQ